MFALLSRVDYCSSLFVILANRLLDRCQRADNNTLLIVFLRKPEHHSPSSTSFTDCQSELVLITRTVSSLPRLGTPVLSTPLHPSQSVWTTCVTPTFCASDQMKDIPQRYSLVEKVKVLGSQTITQDTPILVLHKARSNKRHADDHACHATKTKIVLLLFPWCS